MNLHLDKTKNRYLFGGIAVAICLLLIYWLLFYKTSVSVETAKAVRGAMTVSVDGEGKTRFHDKFTVTAPISGKMSRIKIEEGDNIPKGYIITEIDPNPPSLQRPPAETENFPNSYAEKIYAPAGGKVLRIFEKSERILSAGTPIIEIGNPGLVEIVVDILSTEAARIRPHALVLISSESSAELIKARVRTIEPQAFTKVSSLGVEEQRVNVIADFLTKDTGFGDNFRVDVQIIVWQSDDVLKIPLSALFRNGEKWNVFVIEWGKARRREVTIGHQNSVEAEVLSGLSAGENVILHPPNQLDDGTSVKIQ